MASWWRAVRVPLAAAAGNFWLWPLSTVIVPVPAANVGFNVCRAVLMLWAGSRVTQQRAAGLWGAAIAGVAVMLVDHVALKGGMFLVQHFRGQGSGELSYLMAFGGVVFSFVMFSPLAAFVGLLGGWCGRTPKVSHAV